MSEQAARQSVTLIIFVVRRSRLLHSTLACFCFQCCPRKKKIKRTKNRYEESMFVATLFREREKDSNSPLAKVPSSVHGNLTDFSLFYYTLNIHIPTSLLLYLLSQIICFRTCQRRYNGRSNSFLYG
jgi:hypothetical protein